MEHHVRQLLNKYSGQGVQFVTVIVNPQDNSTAEECESKWLSRGFSPSQMPYIVDVDTSICRRLGVWAAPATVILDSKGHVEYIGAYNIARFCDADDTAYAQKALAAILAGQTPKVRTLPFYGCQVITQAVTPTRV
jgi:alkyl hydroperoxide reductase subunit AhpC